MTLGELRQLCVAKFPDSEVRADIMAGFEAIHERAGALGIKGNVWVDGSFLTQKIDPDDIDFVFLIDASYYESGTKEQYEFIEWLISNEDDPKKSFKCHTDVVLLYPEDSPFYQITVNTKHHWSENVYGYSVTTKEPKGIVVLEIKHGTVSSGVAQ